MIIYRDADPAETVAGGGELEPGASEKPKTGNAFKDAAKDFLEKNPVAAELEVESEVEGVQEGVSPESASKPKAEPKEPEFDPLKDEESELDEATEITEIGVKNEKGEFESRKFDEVLEQAEFTLKHDKKLVKVNGYQKLKDLAQMGLNSTKINTEAKRVFAENQQLKAGFQKAVEAKAIEIANSMYQASVEQDLTDPNATDPNEGGANAKMYRILQKQIQDMKAEQTQRSQQEEQNRQQAAQEQARQVAYAKATEIGDKTVEPFKPFFKDEGGKQDDVAFQRFRRDVKIETTEALEELKAQGHEEVFSPEEVEDVMKKTARKVYKEMDALVERRYKAKVSLKKNGSKSPVITQGGAGTDSSKLNSGEKVTWAKIKAGKFG